jgi:Kef-type K+ transport system membrane component KefB
MNNRNKKGMIRNHELLADPALRRSGEGKAGKAGRAVGSPCWLPRLLVLTLAFASPAAWAAGGEMPSLVRDIGISLLTAGALGVIFTRLKIPSIAAFLLAGIVIGPIGLKLVTDPENIDTIAQLGFILLLFLIGLEIDFKKILGSGKAIILSGLLQYPLTILFGIGGTVLSGSPQAPLYIGVIMAGSSTLLVVKLFQEHFELDTQPGRLALGMLIFQDIWVIVAIIIQPTIENPELTMIGMSFLGILLLSLFTVIVALSFVGRAFTWIAKTPEMTLLGALAWCFIVVFVGVNLDLILESTYGRNFHMAVGPGMAALIAGASIANLPSSTEIITKVATVKDFFITLFFVALGVSIPAPESMDVVILAVLFAVLAIVARQLVFFPLFYFSGFPGRSVRSPQPGPHLGGDFRLRDHRAGHAGAVRKSLRGSRLDPPDTGETGFQGAARTGRRVRPAIQTGLAGLPPRCLVTALQPGRERP